MSAGTATISVTVDGVGPATFLLTVAPPSVATVAISAPDSSVTAGTTLQATAVARDAANNPLPLTGRTIAWSSSALGVASISSTGLISALGPGTTTIGVTVDGVGPATFVLSVAAVPVATVSVSAADSSITSGQTVQATAVARDAANTFLSLVGRTVVWSSSATNVATVNGSGLVTALAAGSTTIGVTVDGVGPATFVLTVAPPSVATVSITAPDSSVTAGDVVQATVVARDAGGNTLSLGGRQVNWSSSATGVATISSAGLITTLTPGTTTIGVTVDGVGPATFVLSVAAVPVASVSVTATDSSITAGQTVQATVVARDAANNILSLSGRAVSWSSSATGVATVSGDGTRHGSECRHGHDQRDRGWRRPRDLPSHGRTAVGRHRQHHRARLQRRGRHDASGDGRRPGRGQQSTVARGPYDTLEQQRAQHRLDLQHWSHLRVRRWHHHDRRHRRWHRAGDLHA